MNYIDAHLHVWTDDTTHYPLGCGRRAEDKTDTAIMLWALKLYAKENDQERPEEPDADDA